MTHNTHGQTKVSGDILTESVWRWHLEAGSRRSWVAEWQSAGRPKTTGWPFYWVSQKECWKRKTAIHEPDLWGNFVTNFQKKTINFWKWGAGGSLRSKKIVAEFLDFRKKRNKFSETRGWGGRGVKGRLDFFPKIHQILGIQSSLIYLISNLSTYDNHYRFLHGQAQRNRAPGSPKQFIKSAWAERQNPQRQNLAIPFNIPF